MTNEIHYNNLIDTLKNAKLERMLDDDTYYERHHIHLKSLGGSNDPENIVLVTPSEHYELHRLGALIFDDPEHIWAWHFIKENLNSKNSRYLNVAVPSTDYDELVAKHKKVVGEHTSKRTKGSMLFYNEKEDLVKRCIPNSELHKSFIDNDDWVRGRRPMTIEQKKKLSAANAGKTWTAERKREHSKILKEAGINKGTVRKDLAEYNKSRMTEEYRTQLSERMSKVHKNKLAWNKKIEWENKTYIAKDLSIKLNVSLSELKRMLENKTN